MNKSSIYLAVAISLVSLSASATGVGPTVQPSAAAMFSGARQIAKEAGLPSEDIVIAQAPATPQSVAAPSPSKDEVKEALSALIATSQKKDNLIVPEIIVALGIKSPYDSLSFAGYPRVDPDNKGGRYFSVVSVANDQKIVIGRIINPENRLRSYLITKDGTFIAATITKKSSDRFSSDPIEQTEAQAGYQDLLGFWVQYYRENLKGKEQITARN